MYPKIELSDVPILYLPGVFVIINESKHNVPPASNRNGVIPFTSGVSSSVPDVDTVFCRSKQQSDGVNVGVGVGVGVRVGVGDGVGGSTHCCVIIP